MSRKPAFLVIALSLIVANFAAAQIVVPGFGGTVVVTPPAQRFIPPSHGQHPVYVSPNEVVGINPYTGGLDTQNRQIDNTAFQYGRNASQHNGTKRWVRRPIYNTHGQVVGYQEGWVWNNSFTGQEHGELINYTPNGQGGVNSGHQSKSVQPGVHKNQQSYSTQQPGVHKNQQSYSTQQPGVHKNYQSFSTQQPGVHKNIQSFDAPNTGGGNQNKQRSNAPRTNEVRQFINSLIPGK